MTSARRGATRGEGRGAATPAGERATRRDEERGAGGDDLRGLALGDAEVAVRRLRLYPCQPEQGQARSRLHQAPAFPIRHSFLSPERILKRSGLSASASFPSSGNGSPSSCDAITSAA